jgi:hypothetical protein
MKYRIIHRRFDLESDDARRGPSELEEREFPSYQVALEHAHAVMAERTSGQYGVDKLHVLPLPETPLEYLQAMREATAGTEMEVRHQPPDTLLCGLAQQLARGTEHSETVEAVIGLYRSQRTVSEDFW